MRCRSFAKRTGDKVDAGDARENEEARQALLTARRHLQEAVVALMFAQARAPDNREGLHPHMEHLMQIAEALRNYALEMLPYTVQPSDIPKTDT